MDRRNLILRAGATALTTGLAGGAGAAPTVSAASKAQLSAQAAINPAILQKVCRIRPNIASLTPAQLAALKTGVSTMMARPASDPTSWTYQAAMHATYATPTLPLWNGCQHGTIHFLSWHRLFLYYFERILRKASGSASFVLPYWNWTADRAMPAPFRDSTAGNPLYTSQRGAGINGGALLPTSAVATSTPMADIPFADFSGDLEGTPHGSVHVACGGLMGQVPTAGQDPIFWLHHCNIDRLWETWIAKGAGRANPATAAWRNKTFTFYDEAGAQRTVAVSKGLDTCAGLGYKYPAPLVLKPLPIFLIAQLSDVRAAQIQAPASAIAVPAALGARAAELKVAVPEAVKAPRAAPGRLYLSFDNIEVDDPEGYYEIYVNPPVGKPPQPTDPSYVGNLVTFGLSKRELAVRHGDMPMPPTRRVFDITPKLAQLRAAKALAGDLRVVLVLRTTEGAALGDAVRTRIGKVQLIAR